MPSIIPNERKMESSAVELIGREEELGSLEVFLAEVLGGLATPRRLR